MNKTKKRTRKTFIMSLKTPRPSDKKHVACAERDAKDIRQATRRFV